MRAREEGAPERGCRVVCGKANVEVEGRVLSVWVCMVWLPYCTPPRMGTATSKCAQGGGGGSVRPRRPGQPASSGARPAKPDQCQGS